MGAAGLVGEPEDWPCLAGRGGERVGLGLGLGWRPALRAVLEAGTTSGRDGGVERRVRCGEGDAGAGRVMLVPGPTLRAR